MLLSRKNIENIPLHDGLDVPGKRLFTLPEKVLQFGTGVLLRGLPDYLVDKANKQGIFNGRIVVVKSTSTGATDAFDSQDGLYTVCERGVNGETKSENYIINASISRVLSANNEWDEILKCAENPALEIVISNTTEVGITLTNDNIHASPPQSFPGKLLAFLYRRFNFFDGNSDKGLVVVPTELIIDNGSELKSIVIQLAMQHDLESSFLEWLQMHNHFCNSLVDRIVPGKLNSEEEARIENELKYHDDLMIGCELYRLWAIEEVDPRISDVLSFAKADSGVVITKNIEIFRELKLRLLNGSHTFSCGLAYLCGFLTVKEAMDNKLFSNYISRLMMQEIVPAIVNEQVSDEMAKEFASRVLDRYRNPYLEHQWLSISVQYSSKMRMRSIPVITKYVRRFNTIPELMALGFAAFLLFMKVEKNADGNFSGYANNRSYRVTDENIASFAEKWSGSDTTNFVKKILASDNLWVSDLSNLPGFADKVTAMIKSLETAGAMNILTEITAPKIIEQ